MGIRCGPSEKVFMTNDEFCGLGHGDGTISGKGLSQYDSRLEIIFRYSLVGIMRKL